MKKRSATLLTSLAFFIFSCGQAPQQKVASQNTKGDIAVGGPCDQCNLLFEGMPPPGDIASETTVAGRSEPGERMEISGTVFLRDGKTPAKDIVLYIYHTNAEGRYLPADTQILGRRNGHLRGWVKTDARGRFRFYSIRPAPYPNGNMPAHVHILVKEPGKQVYYIDEVWFADDKLVTGALRNKAEKRGGDLVIPLIKNSKEVWTGSLFITLGLNVPGYQ